MFDNSLHGVDFKSVVLIYDLAVFIYDPILRIGGRRESLLHSVFFLYRPVMIEKNGKGNVELVDEVDDLRFDLVAGYSVNQDTLIPVGLPNAFFDV